jgi:hypothetical protein
MHRPERLAAFVFRQLERSTIAMFAALVELGFGKASGVLRADLRAYSERT